MSSIIQIAKDIYLRKDFASFKYKTNHNEKIFKPYQYTIFLLSSYTYPVRKETWIYNLCKETNAIIAYRDDLNFVNEWTYSEYTD